MNDVDRQATAEVSAAQTELARVVSEGLPLNDVLKRTIDMMKQVIALPTEISMTLLTGDTAVTPVSSAQLALDLDLAQYALGHGPCLASAEAGEVILIPEMRSDTRWPTFSRVAQQHDVHTSLSIPLPVQRQVIGALNIYGHVAYGFDARTTALAQEFAGFAAVAIANTTLYLTTAQLAAQMREALLSRATIEQAKGILMSRHRCDAEEAFEILVQRSQSGHRKLREIAQQLVQETAMASTDE